MNEELKKRIRDSGERNQEIYDNLVHLYGEEAANALSTMANVTNLIKILMQMAGPQSGPIAVELAREMGMFVNGYFQKLGLDAKVACRDMDMLMRARELDK